MTKIELTEKEIKEIVVALTQVKDSDLKLAKKLTAERILNSDNLSTMQEYRDYLNSDDCTKDPNKVKEIKDEIINICLHTLNDNQDLSLWKRFKLLTAILER